jgi:hypothetical protein
MLPPPNKYTLVDNRLDRKVYEYRDSGGKHYWVTGLRSAVLEWREALLIAYPVEGYGTYVSMEGEDVEAGLIALHACRASSCD